MLKKAVELHVIPLHVVSDEGVEPVEQIRRIDTALGDFLDEARDEYDGRITLIVTADHGGEGRSHGSDSERHVRIPWIAWGDGVPAGGEIPHVRTTDTAPTVLNLIGVGTPAAFTGTPVFPFYAGGAKADVDVAAPGGAQ